ncbi:MAG: hypothetical protein JKY81_01030 [Colwellia sp.]|nr:hypothetical protein [Colwellia sp.]
MNKTLTASLFILCSLNVLAKDGHLTEFVGTSGQINWTDASVSAIGYGVAPPDKNPNVAPFLACRAAIVDAQRNLLESFQGVRVTTTTLVSNYMLTSDVIKSSVEGTIKGAIIKSRNNRLDGSCKIELQAPLRGKTSKSIYQNLYSEELSTSLLNSFWSNWISTAHAATLNTSNTQQVVEKIAELDKRISVLEKHLTTNKVNEIQLNDISGIVIDVRGTHFMPSLTPKIRKANGDILYPSRDNTQDIINNGQLVSLFSNNINFAMEHPLIGEYPLLIKANKTWQDQATEISLSEKNSNKLAHFIKKGLLRNISVIIVL